MNHESPTRLNKRLVELNLASSRRAADELISRGQVSINGQITTNMATTVTARDSIKARGKLGHENKSDITIAFNKPTGYVCTHRRQGSQKTIYDLLPKNFSRLKCIGRLDKDSQGLIILTSDGNLVQQLSHPGNLKEKEYVIVIDQPLNSQQIRRLKEGIMINGQLHQIEAIKKITAKSWRLTLISGLNRQIRRSFAALGISVIKLERVRFGNYHLGILPAGQYRFISKEDKS